MKLQRRIPAILGRIAWLIGLFDILSNVFLPVRGRTKQLAHYLPVFATSAAFATAIFTGLAIMILARGLSHRKRRAWALSVGLLILNLLTEIFRNHAHVPQLILVTLMLVLLLVFRREFYAESDPTTKWRPLFGFISSVVVMFFLGIFILLTRHRDIFIGNPSIKNIALTVIEGFVGIGGPIDFQSARVSDVIETTLAILGFFTLLVPFAMFFRRVKPIAKMSDDEAEQIRKLIRHDRDQDSLGYFATRRDKSVIWSENKKAAIAYRVQSGVMLASGDPIGEFSLWPEVIDKFMELARQHAWTPAAMGCSDSGGEVWVKHAGMQALDIGDEAIIRVKDFTLEGRPMANVRQMVNRIKRKGYSASTTRWSELDEATKSELRILAKKWRYGVPERGFSMSMDRFGDDIDGDAFITIARKEDEIKGLLYFIPWTTHSLSLDRMQRDRETDPGVNELMIVTTVEYAAAQKLENISLNFAAFRSLFERADKISAGPITRGSRNAIRFLSNFFQVESLYRFNAKFDPEWQTRYVIYPKSSDLPAVGWAALRAEKFIQSFRSHSV
jgi:lysyl-tRNA synthetase class 2